MVWLLACTNRSWTALRETLQEICDFKEIEVLLDPLFLGAISTFVYRTIIAISFQALFILFWNISWSDLLLKFLLTIIEQYPFVVTFCFPPKSSSTDASHSHFSKFCCLVDWHYNKTVKVMQGASLVAQMVKNPPAIRETWVRSLGWENPPEEDIETHSSFLA